MDVDKGWAWVVLGASMVGNFLCGVQAYFVGVLHAELLRKYQASNVVTAWVGSLYVSLLQLGAPVASLVIGRFGCRVCSIIGGLLCFFGFVASAFTSTISQLFLTYGFTAGLGLALTYSPTLVTVGYYFSRLRGLATGLACGCAAVGILSGPLLVQNLVEEFRVDGAFLLLGAISLHHCVTGMLYRPSAFERSREVRVPAEESGLTSGQGIAEDSQGQITQDCIETKSKWADLSPKEEVVLNAESCQHAVITNRSIPNNEHGDEENQESCRLQDISDESDFPANVEPAGASKFIQKESEPLMLPNRTQTSKDSFDEHSSETCVTKTDKEDFKVLSSGTRGRRRLCPGALARLGETGEEYRQVLSNSAFLLHCGSLFLSNMHVYGAYLHLPEYAQTLGTSPTMAATLFIAAGSGSLVSRVGAGLLTTDDNVSPVVVSVGMMGVSGLTTLLLPLYSGSYAGLTMFALFLGLYTGGLATLVNMLTIHFVPVTLLHTALGINLFSNGAGAISGPLVAALVIDYGGTYENSFVILGSLILLASVLDLFAGSLHASHARDVTKADDVREPV